MKKISLLLLAILCAAISNAQLTGIKNIPGAYPDLASAITDLNTQGVGSGGVTLNLLAGNPQTAPAGGYAITATGIVANQIAIQGNGNTITTSAGLTAGALTDAIFKLIGSDYVTLSGFTMQENAANTVIAAATNNMTEWGVALLYASVTDGAQNNTIQGNTISLNRTYANTFGIYSNVRHSATDVTTLADITNNTTAPNSNNKFYSNNISNVNQGFVFVGSATAANMDNANDIGGAALGTGNSVTNYGGLGAASTFNGFPTTIIDGAYLVNQTNFNLSFNSFISASLNTAVALRGILTDYSVNPVTTVTDNINNNTVTFTQAGAGGLQAITSAGAAATSVTMNMNNNKVINNVVTASAVTIFGVANLGVFSVLNMNNNEVSGNTSSATTGGFIGATNQGAVVNTINILNNDIGTEASGAVTFSTATSGGITGVSNTAGAATTTLNINGNNFRGFSLVSSGQAAMVINSAAAIGVAINMNNNHVGTATANSISYSAASAGNFFGFVNAAGAATATLSISGNDITRMVQSVTGSGGLNYINNQVFTGSTVINNNTFTNITANSTGGTVLLSNSLTHAANSTHSCNNNSIVTGFNRISASGALTFFLSNGSSPASVTETSTGNNFSNVTITGTSTIAGWQNSDGGSPVTTVTNNTFSNITGGTGAITVLNVGFSSNGTVTGNVINNVTSAGSITGLLSTSGTQTFSGNTVSNLSSTGASSTILGVSLSGGTAQTLTGNTINGLSGSGAAAPLVRGISVSGGTTTNITKNKIYDLSESGAISTTNASVNGILISAGTTVNVSNNLIGNLTAPAASLTDAIRGINITSTTGTSSINASYNTVYINASSSGTNFGTSGIFHTTSTTATTAALTLRNNIIYNNSFANGTGVVAAYRRSSGTANTLNNYNAASNNNLFFAGTPSANRLIYSDGTSTAQTLAAYQAGVFTAGTIAPRDAVSVTELSTPFLSTAGANANFLHINTAVQTVAESGGAAIAGITDDFDGNVRNVTTPDIGADEFTGLTVTACVGSPTAGTITGAANICQGQSTVLSLSGYSSNSGISIQWQSSAVSGGPYAPIAGETGATYNTGVIPTGTTVYYVATITCANGGATATTVQFAVTSNASPTITVNPAAPVICSGGAGVSLTASGGNTYTWSPATGLSATTGATVTANPSVTTTYTVTGTSVAGCSSTTTVTVTVNQSPTIVTIGASNTSICAGTAIDLTSTVNSNLPPVAILSEGFEGGAIPAGWVSINGGTGNLWTIGPVNGTPRTGTRSVEYNWNTTQTASAYLITSGVALTAGVTYSVSSWYKGTGTTFPEKMKVTVGTAQTIAAQTTIIQDLGSITTATYTQQSATFTPAVSGTYYFGWNCYSDPDEFHLDLDDIVISSPSVAPTFSWTSVPAGFTSNVQNPTGVMPTVTTTYILTATNGVSGCSTTGSVTVNVNNPIVSETLVQPTTCVSTDGSITLTVTGGTGGVGPYSYAWIGPGVNPTSQNQVNLGVGSYTVTVTDIPSNCQTIVTYALPGPGGCNICPTVPNLTTNPTPAVCQNANVVLTASALTNMGVTYGITFKQSNVALADPYTGGTVITTVANGALTTGGTVATATTTFATVGNYFIYAILSPSPVDPGCRPFAQATLTVNGLPTVNAVGNQAVCTGQSTAAITFTGTPVGVVYNWTNNTPSIGLAAAGTGNIPAFVAVNNTLATVVATITVTPTFTGGGTTCTGTPRTFTITVNANPTLIISAVPGTTLCQGDPAALTVYEAGPLTGLTVTHSSSNAIAALTGVSCGTAGVNTAVNSFWRAYDLTTFPAVTGNFTINSVNFGIEQLSGGTQLFTIRLYTQTTGVFPAGTRTQIASQTFNVPVQNLSIFTATFTTPVVVSNTATVIVEVEKSAVVNGQFYFPGGNAAAETGPSYISAAACGIVNPVTFASIGFPNTHLVIALAGSVQSLGGIATGTFLWSPAAGLSSTTTNPVAASPAATTTYTVVRTTVPGGCVGTASITLNVNTRPTVTSHPVNVTACATSTTTFSVTGTGTGVTYQWQVSTTGAGGPWSNLANVAPYSNVTTPTLTVNPVTVAMNGWRYRCVLSGTCPPLATENISNSALLTVNALPVVTVSPTAQTCGGVAGINGTPLTASGATSYVWSPIAGLYTNTAASAAYTGTNLATVYAAPTVNTIYTVTGTAAGTGCSNTASVSIVYTPVAPTVVPASASICLGGPAQQLSILAATPITQTFSSGPISLSIPDASLTGANHTIAVPIPPAAVITDMTVLFNMTHTWDGDMAIVLRAPNNEILNLDYFLSGTGGAGATTGFVNTQIGYTGSNALSSVGDPYTGLFKADAQLAAGAFGQAGPNGFLPTQTTWPPLWGTPNGNYTLAMYDGGGGDFGTLTSWSITLTYTVGAPPPVNGVWTPITGLYTDPAGTNAYVAGTPMQTVYANPTTTTTYSVTVSSTGPDAFQTFNNPAPITITNGGSTPYPSNITVTGLPTTGASVQSVIFNGISHTWSDDIDILLQSPTGQNVILMSDVGGGSAITNATYTFTDAGAAMGTGANPTGTYHPTNLVGTLGVEPDNWPAPGPGAVTQTAPALALFGNTANVNGVWKLFAVDDFAGDDGSMAGGWSIRFAYPTPGCTSAPRLVPVTVNVPVLVTTQPVNATVCTDKVATFSVLVSGTAPTYQWQVSTNNGNTFTNITNGGVYSGATSATLTITAPAVTMDSYEYRCIVSGAAPCGSVTSFKAVLKVNPLPTIVITAAPFTRLFPGLTTTLTSTVSPAAPAAGGYTWLRNGLPVGSSTASHVVDVDGLGDYRLRVTDVNGCTNLSNTITISDSTSGKCFIYPNPTDGKFEVRYYSVANNAPLPRSLNVYDAKGERVLTQLYTIGSPYDKMPVDMRRNGKGVYWVEVADANGNRLNMCRIVIQ